MSGAGEERRREVRSEADGKVQLTLFDPLPASFDGHLVDSSASGFRAAHSNSELHTGQEVAFVHPSGRGTARVMWTRIVSGETESGFLIV